MNLSGKLGYIRGLMAGLNVDESTPEGKVMTAITDLLEDLIEQTEINTEIIGNITDYIDEVEDSACGREDCGEELDGFIENKDLGTELGFEAMPEEDGIPEIKVPDESQFVTAKIDKDYADIPEATERSNDLGRAKDFGDELNKLLTESAEDAAPEHAGFSKRMAEREEQEKSDSFFDLPDAPSDLADITALAEQVAAEQGLVQAENSGSDEQLYECVCPICQKSFDLTQAQVDAGTADCPHCGNLLSFQTE